MVGARRAGVPQLVQFARLTPGGTNKHGIVLEASLHGADHLASEGSGALSGTVTVAASVLQGSLQFLDTGCVGAPVTESGGQSSQPDIGIADEWKRIVLASVEGLHVQADNSEFRIFEQGLGAGGEILQPRADGHDDIGLRGQSIGDRCSRHANGADAELEVIRQRRFAGLRYGDRNAVRTGKSSQPVAGLGVEDAAACNDQRSLGSGQGFHRSPQFSAIGFDAPQRPDPFLKEVDRIVEGLRLDILTEAERHRSAVGRTGKHLHGTA